MPTPEKTPYKVSAIVSTYNSERFIEGCLQDLLRQTLGDKLEIIVIDSGSNENEREIVLKYQQTNSNIVYIRTHRETVYQAWNRGVQIAQGEYLSNANTDDRHRSDALKLLAEALDDNLEAAVAYGNSIITDKENETFENCTPSGYLHWPDFELEKFLGFCFIGPHPVWRKSVHNEMGLFDVKYQTAADYEFWLRLAEKFSFVHIPELLGLYWLNENTISRKGDLPLIEAAHIQQVYSAKYKNIGLLDKHSVDHSAKDKSKLLFVMHNYIIHWLGGVELYAYNLIKGLIAKGYSVSVIYPVINLNLDSPRITREELQGIVVYKLESKPAGYMIEHIVDKKIEVMFRELLVREKFDLVHFQHTLRLPYSIINEARKLNIPVCLTLHDFWFICLRTHMFVKEKGEMCSGPDTIDKCVDCCISEAQVNLSGDQRQAVHDILNYRNEFSKKLIQSAGIVTVPSDYLARKYASFGYGKEKIIVSPLGMKLLSGSKTHRRCPRITFGYIGAIHPVKNVTMLAEAFKAVEGDARLAIWGNGLNDSIQEVVDAIANDHRASYFGSYNPDQLNGILNSIDILVIPSKFESYSMTVREALSAGVPVIAANVGGIPDVVKHMINGVLFDPSNRAELREIMQQVVNNPALIDQLRAGKSQIKSIDEDVTEWIERYDRLIKQSKIQESKTSGEHENEEVLGVSLNSALSENPDLKGTIDRLNRYITQGKKNLASGIVQRELGHLPESVEIMKRLDESG